MAVRLSGLVKYWSIEGSYGFIDGGRSEYFCHGSELKDCLWLEASDRVTFIAVPSTKKVGKMDAKEVFLVQGRGAAKRMKNEADPSSSSMRSRSRAEPSSPASVEARKEAPEAAIVKGSDRNPKATGVSSQLAKKLGEDQPIGRSLAAASCWRDIAAPQVAVAPATAIPATPFRQTGVALQTSLKGVEEMGKGKSASKPVFNQEESMPKEARALRKAEPKPEAPATFRRKNKQQKCVEKPALSQEELRCETEAAGKEQDIGFKPTTWMTDVVDLVGSASELDDEFKVNDTASRQTAGAEDLETMSVTTRWSSDSSHSESEFCHPEDQACFNIALMHEEEDLTQNDADHLNKEVAVAKASLTDEHPSHGLLSRLGGLVKSWFPESCYGFISDGRREYFCHAYQLQNCSALAPSDKVRFSPQRSLRRPGKMEASEVYLTKRGTGTTMLREGELMSAISAPAKLTGNETSIVTGAWNKVALPVLRVQEHHQAGSDSTDEIELSPRDIVSSSLAVSSVSEEGQVSSVLAFLEGEEDKEEQEELLSMESPFADEEGGLAICDDVDVSESTSQSMDGEPELLEVFATANACDADKLAASGTAMRLEGLVKSWFPANGYGFIASGGSEYFCHACQLQNSYALAPLDKIKFSPQKSLSKAGKMEAREVYLMERFNANATATSSVGRHGKPFEGTNAAAAVMSSSIGAASGSKATPSVAERRVGLVKCWLSANGYGFLDDGRYEYFCHKSQLKDCGDLMSSDMVRFTGVPSQKRPGKKEARDVYLIERGTATKSAARG